MAALSLDFKDLRSAYTSGVSPSDVIQRMYPRIAAEHGMFITLMPLEDLLSRCRYITRCMLLSVLLHSWASQLGSSCMDDGSLCLPCDELRTPPC